MKISFCIGNGESRQNFDLGKCRDVGPLYGSNAVYRDFHIDNLVVCDLRMAQEVINSGYYKQTNFYTRPKWTTLLKGDVQDINPLPDIPVWGQKKFHKGEHWGSGMFAAYLACAQKSDIVIFIGYDLWGNLKNKLNNVYKNTPNYNKENDRAVDPGHWIEQFVLLFTHFPHTEFIFINNENWRIPDKWLEHGNFSLDNFESLNNILENFR